MSNSSIISGGSPIPAGDTVVADQVTIRGAGTPNSPLRVSGGTGSLARTTPGTFIAGSSVRISSFGGVHAVLSSALAISSADVLGVLTEDSPAGVDLTYQSTGIVTLTTAQWDAIAGTSGGLDPGIPYYLSDVNSGELLPRASITASTHCLTQVGIAISATELQLQISAPIVIP